MYRQASVLADSAAARPGPRCEWGCRAEKELGTQRASEGEEGQPATNLKATRSSQGECAAERRDEQSTEAHPE
jgi:hypothetical protein